MAPVIRKNHSLISDEEDSAVPLRNFTTGPDLGTVCSLVPRQRQLRLLADGSVVTVDENYIRESILDPAAKVVKGYQPLMPTFSGQLSEEELLQLIIYIKSLSADEGAGAVEATTSEATSSEAAS